MTNGFFSRTIHTIDRVTLWLGLLAACCALLMAVVTATVVLWRYAFDGGSLALQESTHYLFATIFMLGAALTLQRQGHVRVDIFYRRWSRRMQAWIDAVGTVVFLLPLAAFIGLVSVDYVLAAWAVREGSADPGGLPAVYLWKTLIPVMAASLFLQGCAELLRNLAILTEASVPRATDLDQEGARGG